MPKARKLTQAKLAEALGMSLTSARLNISKGMPADSVAKAMAWRAKHIAKKADNVSIGTARLERTQLDVEAKRLDLEERKRNLVPRAEAEKVLFEEARRVRDGLLSFPLRIAPLLAARFGLDHGELLSALEDEVRRHLSEMAGRPSKTSQIQPVSAATAAEMLNVGASSVPEGI